MSSKNVLEQEVLGLGLKPRSDDVVPRRRRYLETVRFLLAVPNGAGQWELLADPILFHGPQRPPSQPFRFSVVRVQPQFLELGVRFARKAMRLEDLVQRVKVPPVEGDQRSRSHHRFVSVQRLPG